MKRGLTIREAAKHCGITPSAYRQWMRNGRVPKPWPGTKRIDLIQLDHALDKMSNRPDEPGAIYDQWKQGKLRLNADKT